MRVVDNIIVGFWSERSIMSRFADVERLLEGILVLDKGVDKTVL